VKARRGHALFHAIVSVGAASVQACGGVAVDESRAGDGHGSGASNGGSPSTAADTGGATSSFSSAGGYAGAASGPSFVPIGSGGVTAAAGGSPSASADASAGSAAMLGSGGFTDGGPTDGGSTTACAYTAQLFCATWDPAPQGCWCDPNAPRSAADCPNSNFNFQCHSYTPLVGCNCVCVVCIH